MARIAVVADPSAYGELKDALSGTDIQAASGEAAVVEAAERPADWVMAAVSGAVGLKPTLAAVKREAHASQNARSVAQLVPHPAHRQRRQLAVTVSPAAPARDEPARAVSRHGLLCRFARVLLLAGPLQDVEAPEGGARLPDAHWRRLDAQSGKQ